MDNTFCKYRFVLFGASMSASITLELFVGKLVRTAGSGSKFFYSESDASRTGSLRLFFALYDSNPIIGTPIISSDDEQGDADTWVQHIKEEILLVGIVDIAIIGKEPGRGPGVKEYERVPCKRELRLARHDRRLGDYPIHAEGVLATELSLELRVGDVSALVSRTREGSPTIHPEAAGEPNAAVPTTRRAMKGARRIDIF